MTYIHASTDKTNEKRDQFTRLKKDEEEKDGNGCICRRERRIYLLFLYFFFFYPDITRSFEKEHAAGTKDLA